MEKTEGLEGWLPPSITVVGDPLCPPNHAYLIDPKLGVQFFGLDRMQLSRMDIGFKRAKVSLWRRLKTSFYVAYWAFKEAWNE